MNRRMLKSLLFAYLWVVMLLLIAVLSVWELKTRGYVSVKYYRFYGEEAKTTAFLMVLAAVGSFIYCTYWAIVKVSNPQERQRYLKEIEKSSYFICSSCGEPFTPLSNEQESVSCPKCGGTDVEELSGFFKRHPEKKRQCPLKDSSNLNGPDRIYYQLLFGIIATVAAGVIILLVMSVLGRIGVFD